MFEGERNWYAFEGNCPATQLAAKEIKE